MLVKSALGVMLVLGSSCAMMSGRAGRTSYLIEYGGVDGAPVTESWLEYGGDRHYMGRGGTFIGLPRIQSPFVLEWRDSNGVLHRARIEFSDAVFRSPPPNERSWSVKLIVDASNRVEMSYQSRNHEDPSTYDDWHDLASEMTMLPVEDPRDQPVVRKLAVSKQDHPRFKSKRKGDTYIGPNGLFQAEYKDIFGTDVEIVEATTSWPYRVDLPQESGAADQISMTAISSLSTGAIAAIGFREVDPSAQDVLSAVRTFEEERIARYHRRRALSYEPEISRVEEGARAHLEMVLPNQEFSRFNYPFGYDVLGDDLQTVGVARSYVIKGHWIQIGAVLPLPREGMTVDEAKDYGLEEMERIMDAITFPD